MGHGSEDKRSHLLLYGCDRASFCDRGQDRILEAQRVLDLLKVQEVETYLRNTRSTDTQPLSVLRPEQEILKRYNALNQDALALGNELADLEK